MISPVLYGLNAGLSMSPHTVGGIMTALKCGRKNGYFFITGGMVFDILLVALLYLCTFDLKISDQFVVFMQSLSGLVTIRLGIQNRSKKKIELNQKNENSFLGGFLIQLFNPNPYIFWIVIGLPQMANSTSFESALSFFLLFMIFTYGLKYIMIHLTLKASHLTAHSYIKNIQKILPFFIIFMGIVQIVSSVK